jgi:hypothetical protein
MKEFYIKKCIDKYKHIIPSFLNIENESLHYNCFKLIRSNKEILKKCIRKTILDEETLDLFQSQYFSNVLTLIDIMKDDKYIVSKCSLYLDKYCNNLFDACEKYECYESCYNIIKILKLS